jgi:IclR family acetate operon transcriptional repressor
MNQSLTRAFKIIESLADEGDWVGLSVLAHRVGLDEATVYRFLATLKSLGYVRQRPADSRYQLTLKFGWLASRLVDSHSEFSTIADPRMRALAREIGESVQLSVFESGWIVHVDKADGNPTVRMRSRVGSRAPAHATASGKAILAFMPDTDRQRAIGELELTAVTPETITDRAGLEVELAATREHGYAVDNEENETGIRSIAAPVFDYTGMPVAAMSISGWTLTMTPERLSELAPELIGLCSEISQELGHVALAPLVRSEATAGGVRLKPGHPAEGRGAGLSPTRTKGQPDPHSEDDITP